MANYLLTNDSTTFVNAATTLSNSITTVYGANNAEQKIAELLAIYNRIDANTNAQNALLDMSFSYLALAKSAIQEREANRLTIYQHILERSALLDILKKRPLGLWVHSLHSHLKNAELKSRNTTYALGYGYNLTEEITLGTYFTKSSPNLRYQLNGASTKYKETYGVGVYGFYHMNSLSLSSIIDYKHLHSHQISELNSLKERQESYGLLLDIAYNKLNYSNYQFTPSIQYQFNHLTANKSTNSHQLGIQLSGNYIFSKATSFDFSLGIAGIYTKDPRSAYKLSLVDLRTWPPVYDISTANSDDPGISSPYYFYTAIPTNNIKKIFETKLNVKVGLQHKFTEQTSLNFSLGYNSYLKTKFKGLNYGINLNHQF